MLHYLHVLLFTCVLDTAMPVHTSLINLKYIALESPESGASRQTCISAGGAGKDRRTPEPGVYQGALNG